MKNLKKFCSIILSLCLILSFAIVFVGCDDLDNTAPYPPVPKAEYRAAHFNVINKDFMNQEETLMMITLQGITANLTDQQIYLIEEYQKINELLLDELVEDYGITYKYYDDPWEIFEMYKDYINGFIVCDLHTPSVNVATTFAGTLQGVAIDVSMVEIVQERLGLSELKDVRGWTEEILTREYMNQEGISDTIAFELSYNDYGYLRDYVAMSKGLMFWVGVTETRDMVMNNIDLRPGGIVMGYGDWTITGDEFSFFEQTGKNGYNYIGCDRALNVSVLSGFDPIVSTEQRASTDIEYTEGKHYVAFVVSDGDYLLWNMTGQYPSEMWWNSPYMGDLNITWTLSPLFSRVLAPAQNRLYRMLSDKDYIAYMHTNCHFSNDPVMRQADAKRLNDNMVAGNAKYAVMVNRYDFLGQPDEHWAAYLNQPQIEGIISGEYSNRQDYHKGMIKWVAEKPVTTYSDAIVHKHEMDSFVNAINKKARDTEKNVPTATTGYSLVFVNNWNIGVSEMKEIAAKFDDNVELINLDQYFKLIKQYNVGK